MNLKKEIKAYIEAELRDYHETRKELEQIKVDIAEATPSLDSEGSNRRQTGTTSKPTESKAISILTNKRIKRMEQVVRAIEITIGELPQDKLQLVELKYWQRPRRLTDTGIAMELCVSKRTIYKWTNAICMAIAVELGLANKIGHKTGTFGG